MNGIIKTRRPGAVSESADITNQLLVSARQAAAMCGRSLRTWRSLDSAGRIPRPVRINRATLWRTNELRAWVDAGCPDRENWEAQR